MNRCRIPEICERYKIDIGIFDPKSRRILPTNAKTEGYMRTHS